MKLFQLCFLVLVNLCVSRQQSTPAPLTSANVTLQENTSSQQPHTTSHDVDVNKEEDLNNSTIPTTTGALNGTTKETTNASAPTTSSPAPVTPPPPSKTTPEGKKDVTSEDPGSTTPVFATTKAVAVSSGSTAWGYIILVLILILIVALCIILFMLRRASRTYSFDLQRPVPSSNAYEPTGTFGQVYLDDLDRPVNKDVISDDLRTTPVPNGTSSQLEEKAAEEENAPQEQTEASNPQNSSSSSSSSSSSISLSGHDQEAEKKSNQMSSNNLFFDAMEEPQQPQQNENNNNPSVSSSSPFVEINLDEPAWSDQLLTSPLPTSSVLPFSSFSSCSSTASS